MIDNNIKQIEEDVTVKTEPDLIPVSYSSLRRYEIHPKLYQEYYLSKDSDILADDKKYRKGSLFHKYMELGDEEFKKQIAIRDFSLPIDKLKTIYMYKHTYGLKTNEAIRQVYQKIPGTAFSDFIEFETLISLYQDIITTKEYNEVVNVYKALENDSVVYNIYNKDSEAQNELELEHHDTIFRYKTIIDRLYIQDNVVYVVDYKILNQEFKIEFYKNQVAIAGTILKEKYPGMNIVFYYLVFDARYGIWTSYGININLIKESSGDPRTSCDTYNEWNLNLIKTLGNLKTSYEQNFESQTSWQ